uniref:Collagen alpha-2(VI) chain n=1 Tax=Denticeps clupeoides TaxID=299321 RepID=A0AAY4AWV8_9TELE
MSAGVTECPVFVYFVLDTSETIALQEVPPGSLVNSVKAFTKAFAQKLQDELYNSQTEMIWSMGGLHFSQRTSVFSDLTGRERFSKRVDGIRYFGRGTYIDCALANMTREVTRTPTRVKAVRFAVVVTDGHATGNPCGGIVAAAEQARDKGIRLFAVAASNNVDENGLRLIADSPTDLYRHNYVAVDLGKGKPEVVHSTVDRIIEAMGDPGIEGPIGRPGPKVDVVSSRHHLLKTEQGYGGDQGRDGRDGQKGRVGRIGAPGCKGDPGEKGPDGYPGEAHGPGPAGKKGLTVGSAREKSNGIYRIHAKELPSLLGFFLDIGLPGPRGLPGDQGALGINVGTICMQNAHEMHTRTPLSEGSNRMCSHYTSHHACKPSRRTGKAALVPLYRFKGDSEATLLMKVPCRLNRCVLQGPAGDPGEAGPRGIPGPSGPMGDPGRPGFSYNGPRGPTGNRGEKGTQGLRGSRGDCGAKGEPGIKGRQGEPGEPGPHGEPGSRGARGDPGVNECDVMGYIRETCGCCDCEKQCGAVDVVFMIDSSESIGLTNFTLEKHFVLSTINRLGTMASDPGSETGTRVGIVQFSHNGTFEAVRLNDPKINSLSAFKQAVKNLQWIAGGTWTPSAVKFAYDNLIRDRQRARAKVSFVLITDGRYDPRDDEALLPALCGDDRVDVTAIGIGDMFDKEMDAESLESITCNRPERVRKMSRFTDLVAEDFLDQIETVLCPSPTVVCPDVPCQTELEVARCADRPVDLVFLVDGSERLGPQNFQAVREFVEKVAGRLTLATSKNDPKSARLALLQYGAESQQSVAFPLTHNRTAVQRGLADMTYLDSSSSVAPAVHYAISSLASWQVRRGAEVNFVFVTDGVTATEGLKESVAAMRGKQVVPTVVAMGSDVDRDVLLELAMNDRHAIFTSPAFAPLPDRLLESFVRWVC